MIYPQQNAPTIGLALGGGGARGIAHIGVLRVLEREQVPVHFIAGTSMGGIIGASYAAGVSLDAITGVALQIRKRTQQLRLLDIKLTGRGLIKGTRLYRQLAGLMGEELTFAELKIPTVLMAVDLFTGREVALSEGKVVDAIRATMSVPGVFEPVPCGELLLVDGGILNNVPVDVVAQAGMQLTIAVDVMPDFPRNQPGQAPIVTAPKTAFLPPAMQDVMSSFLIMISEMTEYRLRLHRPDLVLRPQISNQVSLLTGFELAEEVIAAGEAAAQAALPEIRRLIEQKQGKRSQEIPI
jgi:NTE family protein